MQGLRHFARELQRRRVFRTAGIYIVGAWVLLQVVALAFQSFGIPDAAMQYVWVAAITGFPLVLVFGWRYDITSVGIILTAPAVATDAEALRLRKPDYVIITALAAVALIVVGSMVNEIRQGPLRGSGPWYTAGSLVTGIAVLPLENLSGDDSQGFLSAGLHDALITTLSRITRFKVTSRYSSQRVRRDMPLPDIGRLLGADKLLAGSVMREGDQVRVNVTLMDAETEEPIWAETYLREFDGLISMQNEIASAVAREVKVQLTPEEERHLTGTESPDAATYETYLKGMFQLRKATQRGYRRAIEIFTEAVENDPSNALAYAGLAIGYSQLGHSPFPAAGAYPRAREAAERALEFDPELAEAHLAVGMYKIYYEWDFAAGEQAFLKALALNPSLVDAHYHYAWLLELMLRDEEALRYGEYTKELNPLSPFYSSWLVSQYRDAGMYDKAVEEALATLELNPRYPVAWYTLGNTYLDMGLIDDAIAAHENLRDDRFWGWAYATTLAAAGREDEFAAVFESLKPGAKNSFTLALTYGALGDTEQTIHWLGEAKDNKIPWFPWQVNWFPQTKFLHDDPRMHAFADELGINFPAYLPE